MTEFDILQPTGVPFSGKNEAAYGLLIALGIISIWAISLGGFLALDLATIPVWLLPLAVLWQMFLYTGLFITAHDAMHGSVYPGHSKINHLIGSFAVCCYGLFSYSELIKKHWLHHRHPASDRDPDFHNGTHKHPVAWYLYFMRRYSTWQRIMALSALFNFVHYVFHIPASNLLLFWVIPSLLSSMQLFYFGTFLTHSEPEEGYSHPHRSRTIELPIILSFLTCYHFGYHQEHHEYPHVPWWQLPAVHNSFNPSSSS